MTSPSSLTSDIEIGTAQVGQSLIDEVNLDLMLRTSGFKNPRRYMIRLTHFIRLNLTAEGVRCLNGG